MLGVHRLASKKAHPFPTTLAHLSHLACRCKRDQRAVGRQGSLQIQHSQGGAVLQRIHCGWAGSGGRQEPRVTWRGGRGRGATALRSVVALGRSAAALGRASLHVHSSAPSSWHAGCQHLHQPQPTEIQSSTASPPGEVSTAPDKSCSRRRGSITATAHTFPKPSKPHPTWRGVDCT